MPSDSAGLVEPPDTGTDGSLSLGGGGGGPTSPPPPNKKKMLILGGVGALILGGAWLLARRNSASSGASAAGTSAAIPTLIAPSSNQDSVSGNNLAATQGMIDAQGNAFTSALANARSALEAEIAALQSAAPVASNAPVTVNNSTYSPALAPAPTDAGIGTMQIGNIIGVVDEGGGKAVYATDRGFVYAVGGAQYYGGTNAGSIGGAPASRISGIKPTADGGYALYTPGGLAYNFGPNAKNPAPGPAVYV